MNISKGLVFLFILANSYLLAQEKATVNYQEHYLKGKEHFRSAHYEAAIESFSIVTKNDSKNSFRTHAQFYFALSHFHLQNLQTARDMLLQILEQNSSWSSINEVHYWLAVISFELQDDITALDWLSKIDSDQAKKQLKSHYLIARDSVNLLQNLLEKHPYDSTLAKLLAVKMSEQELSRRNPQMVDFLIREFGINPELFGLAAPQEVVKKEVYKVAVILPFLMYQLDKSAKKKPNQFVLDLFYGIKLAAEQLKEEGIDIRLYMYDNERDSSVTATILAQDEMKGMDLIIGPLFPKPTELVTQFGLENKINVINPLSTNSIVIKNNPYSYLYRSSAETQARAAASFAISRFENKNVFIAYSLNERDLIFAEVYAEELAKAGFQINLYHQIVDAADSKNLLDILTEVYKEEIEEETVEMINTRKVRIGEDDSLLVSRDSVGHIMLVSRDHLAVTNVISAVRSRGDSIPLIGFDEWLEIDQISLETFQDMEFYMLAFNYTDIREEKNIQFKRDYVERYSMLPTQFSYHGYELMHFFARQMYAHGKYFGTSLRDAGKQNGYFFDGFDYSLGNDNQVMPIVELYEFEIIKVREKEVEPELEDDDDSEQ